MSCWLLFSLEEVLCVILPPVACHFCSFRVRVSSNICDVFCGNWTEQDYFSLECGSPPADHLQSNDGSSPEPRALLALTLGSWGCRLEQWPLTCERQTDRRWAFPVLTYLIFNDVKLPVWLNIKAGLPVFACAVQIFPQKLYFKSNLHTSSSLDTLDHAWHLGSCCCWPLAFNAFDHRKRSLEFPWPHRSLWNSNLILHLPWQIHPSGDRRVWINCHQN